MTSCPNCGGSLDDRMLECEYCRSKFGAALSEEELRESCLMLIESMNKRLSDLFSARLLLIFVIGVVLCPVGVYFLVKFYEGGTILRWSLVGVAALGGMVIMGCAIGMEESRIYRKELQPRIQGFLKKNKLQPEEFLAIARSVLKKGDSLFEHLDRLI
ncbi:MAG: hypothetical protein JRJ47_05850 [Deltaproteobacteria bacterium]|nr:hypothetical protein [Deltaproteobacteria bacterium]